MWTTSEDLFTDESTISTLYEQFPNLAAGPLTYLMDVEMEVAVRLVKKKTKNALPFPLGETSSGRGSYLSSFH